MRCIAFGVRRESKSRRRKARPGITILAANDRNPTADSRSLWEMDVSFSRSLTVFLALASLSGGSLAYIRILSNSIPRKSAVVPIISLK